MEALGIEDVDEATEAFIPLEDDGILGAESRPNDIFDAGRVRVIDVFAPKYTYAEVEMPMDTSKGGVDKWTRQFGTTELSAYRARVAAWPDLLASMSSRVGGVVTRTGGERFETMVSVPYVSGCDKWQVAVSDAGGAGSEYMLKRSDGAAIVLDVEADSRFELEPGVAYTNVDQLLSERGRLRKVTVSFRPYDDVAPIQVPVSLPLLRVHCPHHAGCTAELTVKSTREEERTLGLEFPGLGLTGKQRLTVRYSTGYPATEQCVQWVVPATLRIYFGRTLVNGAAVAEGTRFVLSVPRSERVEEPLGSADDACELLPPDVAGEGIDRRAIDGKGDDLVHDLEETAMTSSGILTVALPLGGSMTKVGLSFTRSSTIDFSLATRLSRHARYVKVPIDDPIGQREVCWHTEV